MNNNLKAFIIMPFGSEFDIIFNDLIKPPLEELGYEVTKADSILDQHNILKDIIRTVFPQVKNAKKPI